MDLGLAGKKAIITGGTKGIGRAIADLLADEGADVGICARHEGEVDAAVAALAAKGVNATGAAVDVADGDGLISWIEAAAGVLGGIDLVVANVSAMAVVSNPDAWRRSVDLDILGTVNTVGAALPHLRRSEAGSIVAISSVAGVEAIRGASPYTAVKAAMIAYVKGLSRELAPAGIRANAVSPGTIFFEGGVWHRRQKNEPDFYQAALAQNPMGRMGSAEEVANAAVFLLSPRASFVTGTNLIVDGAITQRIQF